MNPSGYLLPRSTNLDYLMAALCKGIVSVQQPPKLFGYSPKIIHPNPEFRLNLHRNQNAIGECSLWSRIRHQNQYMDRHLNPNQDQIDNPGNARNPEPLGYGSCRYTKPAAPKTYLCGQN